MHRSFLAVLVIVCSIPLSGHSASSNARSDFEARVNDTITLSSIHRKARSLARWADESGGRGANLPVDLIPTISRALSLGPDDAAEQLLTANSRLLGYGNELGLLEDDPASIGRAKLDGPGRLVAGQSGRLKQIYEVGTTLEPGAALAIAKHWSYPYSLQTTRPDANNYIKVSTDAAAQLGVGTVLRNGVHGGLYRDARLPLIEVRSGRLKPGDTITIEYGAGSRGFTLPDRAMENFILPLYLRRAANDAFVMVPVDTMEVVGGPVKRLTAVLPSKVPVGQPVDLRVRLEDEFGNLATGNLPSLEVLVDGLFRDRIPAGQVSLGNLVFESPGVRRIEVRSSGGGVVGTSNPVLVLEKAPDYEIRWADLHRHSSLSDGTDGALSIEGRALTDITLVVDHDNYLGRSHWHEIKRHNDIKGFEWSLPVEKGGHHVVLTRDSLDFDHVLRERFPSLRSLVRGLESENTMIIALPETPADDRFQDPALTRLVEIKSGEGTFEWMGDRFAQAGIRVGFTGSANSHMSGIGRMSSHGVTAVYVAPGENWWHALRERRTYVTSGARMILQARMNGAMPGSRIPEANERILRGEVIGTAGISSVELIRNGVVVDRRDFASSSDGKTVRVTMASGTEPWADERDLPRNGREWIGYFKVSGNSIESTLAPGFTNPSRQAIAVNPAEEGRVDFITWTRGQPSSFMVNLISDDLNDVMFELNLKSGFEDVDQIPRARSPQPIPAIRQQVAALDLRSRKVTRTFNVSGYHDTVTFEFVELGLPVRQSFEFVDTRDSTSDYYYLRIRQINDEYLWSTPFWVGGFDVH